MADTKISGATAFAGSGAASRPAARAGSTTAYRTVDNLTASTNPAATDDSGSGYHVGSMWYRPATGEMWTCTDATSTAAVWVPRAGQFSNPRYRFYAYTDCVMGSTSGFIIDHWRTNFSGTGSQIGAIAIGSFNALGIYSLDLGTTTTGRCSLVSGTFTQVKLGGGQARFASRAAIHALSTGTETYTTRIGFIDSETGESTDGCFFRYTDGVNSGKWQAVCRSNGTETTADTGVTPVADTFQRFEVVVNAAGTSVAFNIDGSLVATITTNIPTGAGRETGYGIMGLKSAGTTATSGAYIDYVEVECLFTTAR